jgi:hypothetical protein
VASGLASIGVPIAPRIAGVSVNPAIPTSTAIAMKNSVAVPTTRLAIARSPAPTAWPIMMFAAMLMPNMAPSIRK